MKTKSEIAKEVFFEATRSKRSLDNYVDGMFLIEILAKKNSSDYLRYVYGKLNNAEIDAETALARLVDCAWQNTCGVNGYTDTSVALLKAYHRFF